MNRWLAALGVLGAGVERLCQPANTRASQASRRPRREKDLAIRSIGDVTEVTNANRIQVSGIGLVTGLDGTGQSPKGIYYKMLEQQLRKQKIENVKAILESPNNAYRV